MKLFFEASIGLDVWFGIKPMKLSTLERNDNKILEKIKKELIKNLPQYPELKNSHLEIYSYNDIEDKISEILVTIVGIRTHQEKELFDSLQICKGSMEQIEKNIESEIRNYYRGLINYFDSCLEDYEISIDDWKLS